jgi:hypothetical protein
MNFGQKKYTSPIKHLLNLLSSTGIGSGGLPNVQGNLPSGAIGGGLPNVQGNMPSGGLPTIVTNASAPTYVTTNGTVNVLQLIPTYVLEKPNVPSVGVSSVGVPGNLPNLSVSLNNTSPSHVTINGTTYVLTYIPTYVPTHIPPSQMPLSSEISVSGVPNIQGGFSLPSGSLPSVGMSGSLPSVGLSGAAVNGNLPSGSLPSVGMSGSLPSVGGISFPNGSVSVGTGGSNI